MSTTGTVMHMTGDPLDEVVIGKGATATVRAASDKLQVVKSFHSQVPLMDIRREITIHKHLSLVRPHPHIIRFISAHQDSEQRWHILMERAVNGELFDRIEPDVGFPENIAQRYFMQLLSAVQHLHAEGIAHRDIKPENLLLGADFTLKLADFGMATVYRKGDHRRQLSSSIGTRMYAAPEILNGSLYDGEKVDVWSMGVVLYVMLVGDVPWSEASGQCEEFMDYKRIGRLPVFINQDALDLIHSMLKIDPDKRVSLVDIPTFDWLKTTLSTPPSLSHPDQVVNLQSQIPGSLSCFSQPIKPSDTTLMNGTRFRVLLSKQELLQDLMEYLKLIHIQVKLNVDKILFGTIDKRNNILTGVISVFSMESSPCDCEVVFQKRRGDCIEFKRLFLIVSSQFTQ